MSIITTNDYDCDNTSDTLRLLVDFGFFFHPRLVTGVTSTSDLGLLLTDEPSSPNFQGL